MGEPITHELKCWPVYWDATRRGDKPFDVRKNDRGFQTGDIVRLHRYDPSTGCYVAPDGSSSHLPQDSGTISLVVTWILQGGQFGIEPAYCVLGFGRLGRAAIAALAQRKDVA